MLSLLYDALSGGEDAESLGITISPVHDISVVPIKLKESRELSLHLGGEVLLSEDRHQVSPDFLQVFPALAEGIQLFDLSIQPVDAFFEMAGELAMGNGGVFLVALLKGLDEVVNAPDDIAASVTVRNDR